MRAVVQRVKSASVEVSGKALGTIGHGIVVLLGISAEDSVEDTEYLVNKILKLRIFENEDRKMDLNISDVNGEVLVVSQFTLYGDCRKGNRPSYDKAGKPEYARSVYFSFLEKIRESGLKVEEGEFGAFMEINLSNSGPVTILLDSKKLF